jgi:NitT/TauT family transport system substrate-binding protein
MATSRRRSLAWRAIVVATLTVASLAAACGDDGNGGTQDSGAQEEPTSARLILGWVAGPQFGGFYTADEQGFFDEENLDVELVAGPVESPIQIVAAGEAQFGFGDADELLQARAQGIPVVGVFANFQTALRILISHEEDALQSFEDLSGRTMYVDLGDAWWEFIKQTYELQDVEERAYNGQAFLQDKSAVIQGYAGDELELSAADPSASLVVTRVAESGWNPYMQVLFVSEEFAQEQPDVVRSFVEASIRGWEYYRENNDSVNEYMATQGAEAPVDVMNEQAQIYEPFIFEGGFPAEMTAVRWEETLDALKLTEVLTEDVDVSQAYTNEYLPSG